MSRAQPKKMQRALPPWFTAHGIDLQLYPIDGVLRQALSSDDREFQSACSILKSMCSGGRIEAGIFLIGLQRRHSENYGRLTTIADALECFQCPETVNAFASELRRVSGSSITRRYLRRVIDALATLPPELARETIQSLSSDPLVGTRFRQHLKELTNDNAW